MQDDKGPRGHQGMGGDPAGEIPMVEQHWARLVKACCGTYPNPKAWGLG